MTDPTPRINLADFETAAVRELSQMVYDYYAGGAGDEVLLGTSRAAWNAIALRYRVLRDVSSARSLARSSGRSSPGPCSWPQWPFSRWRILTVSSRPPEPRGRLEQG